jgi:hypothetical protein
MLIKFVVANHWWTLNSKLASEKFLSGISASVGGIDSDGGVIDGYLNHRALQFDLDRVNDRISSIVSGP